MSIAFLFPGQGSQHVGMAADIADAYPAAAAVLSEVDEALGEPLSRLMREGPVETLSLTANAQPALMAASLATLAALEAEGVTVEAARFLAGHSLGEYAALAAAGSLSVADAARLLRIRGEAMQAAVPVGEGAMAALLGLDADAAAAVAADAAEGAVIAIANDNAPGQCVVSGERAAVERAVALARERGARKPVLLPVSAPFHSPLMAPAAERMAAVLAAADIRPARVPVVSNVAVAPVTAPDEIRRLLVEQVTGRVRWRESMAFLEANGVARAFELGAGKVLTGLSKRAAPAIAASAVNGPADVAAAAAAIAGARAAE